MVSKIFFLALTGLFSAMAQDPKVCSTGLDLALILDSSSSVGVENFQLVRDFATRVVEGLDISNKATRVSVARFNSWLDIRSFFSGTQTEDAVKDVIAKTPYYGQGTMTGIALRQEVDQVLKSYNGWRQQTVPTVAIVLTDGKAQDPIELRNQASRLRANCTAVIAIGVGSKVNETELNEIATTPASENVFLVNDFNELTEPARVDSLLQRVCAAGEDTNECLVNNGGCNQRCVNTINSFYCECRPGYLLGTGGLICTDIDECLSDNGGCQQNCINEPGSYRCSCQAGYLVSNLGKFCVKDSCFENTACEQTCNNIVGGTFSCSCGPGYTLNKDGRTCTDIDECRKNNGGCEDTCVNSPGSYVCECPDGFGLRDDGRTCGVQCYGCNRARSNADCQDTIVCGPNALSCETVTRRENGVDYISKGCKQTEACANNFIQNPRTAASPTQCNENADGSSVCRCCCHDSLCNAGGRCNVTSDIAIECPNPFSLFTIDADANMTCSSNAPYQIGATCSLTCRPGYGPLNGQSQITCQPQPRSFDGFWNGILGACADINECLTNNGDCSHTCTNSNGSYICSCPGAKACADQPLDLYFILDSSSSIGQSNWDLMIQFVADVGNRLNIGLESDQVRVGALTFNKLSIPRFDFNQVNSSANFEERLKAIVYEGRGTRTARAIDTVLRNAFSAADGRRSGVPLAVVVITDGRSSSPGRIPSVSAALNRVADEILVIGVTNKVNIQQIREIADNNPSNYRLLSDFTDLDSQVQDLLVDRFCTQPEEPLTLTSDQKSCDFDECSINDGGCSDDCVNTVGSYICTCPTGETIANDRRTCIPDVCANNTGGCEERCENIFGGRLCYCNQGRESFDETRCRDYDECSDENGGCSNGCENLSPGYRCTCPPGLYLADNKEDCLIDSCFNQVEPNKCDQLCTNIPSGGYICSCERGYLLGDGGHNCTDINECANQNGGCEQTCVNTPGSYRCECEAGLQLRPDNRTCGISCYTCQNVLSNDECNTARSCAPGQDSCFATIRVRNNVTSITKGCQQTEACINNLIQNPRSAGEGPSQCNTNGLNSRCVCCCVESMCNAGVCPYNYTLPGCPIFERQDVVFRGLQDTSDVSPGGVALLVCPEGFQFSEGGNATTQLNCLYDFQNKTSAWSEDASALDVCVDIDECTTENNANKHDCVAPATCDNLPGTFECVCPTTPDDYTLVDGRICERDECSDPDKGGCTDNCTNTVGGYFCSCPPGQALTSDNRTCTRDVCADGNGGCDQVCTNTLTGRECSCFANYVLASDGLTCNDVNECLTNNGGCQENCTNLVPGYMCSCNEDQLLNNDGFTCRSNPCFGNNGGCDQTCHILAEGFRCSCSAGYNLLDDGSCQDIDECAVNRGGCQFNCTNTEGSFFCTCPEGQALRKNGRTCGRACYSCNGLSNNTECNNQPLEICPFGADSCENEVRILGGRKQIFKRCKQSHACNNNFLQNNQPAWEPTQCNPGSTNDVCRCCCEGHLCNINERPCAVARKCTLPRADVVIVADSSSSVKFDNFQIMKSFINELLQSFNLGQDAVHSALLRYNRDTDLQFGLNGDNDREQVQDLVAAMPYRGSGTRTGAALQYVVDNILTAADGARAEVPKIVVTITDGRSQDPVLAPSEALRRDGALTFAVGVGNVDKAQLDEIAGSDDRVFVAEDFNALSGIVLENVQQSLCQDVDECATNNGGCAQNCTNLDGSYQCSCGAGFVLDADLRSCTRGTGKSYVDECAASNGGCGQTCTNTLDGAVCSCEAGYQLGTDGKACFAIDECREINGTSIANCSDTCVDTSPGYFCECPANKMLSSNNRTCVDRPGEADCPANFSAVGHSCMRLTADAQSYDDASSSCAAMGATLANLNSEGLRRAATQAFPGNVGKWFGLRNVNGVWQNADGSPFTSNTSWAPNQPKEGSCAVINSTFYTSDCSATFRGICEIPRTSGYILFTNTWPNGANGFLYMPTGEQAVRVVFPFPVSLNSVWWGTVMQDMSTDTQFVITQTEIQEGSGKGAVGMSIDMKNNRYPVSRVTVENYP